MTLTITLNTMATFTGAFWQPRGENLTGDSRERGGGKAEAARAGKEAEGEEVGSRFPYFKCGKL